MLTGRVCMQQQHTSGMHNGCERQALLCRYANGAYAGLAGAKVGAGGPGGRQDLLLSGDNGYGRLGEQDRGRM